MRVVQEFIDQFKQLGSIVLRLAANLLAGCFAPGNHGFEPGQQFDGENIGQPGFCFSFGRCLQADFLFPFGLAAVGFVGKPDDDLAQGGVINRMSKQLEGCRNLVNHPQKQIAVFAI